MMSETLSSVTLTRFWSYHVASRLPSAASTRVRWASGSVVSSSGRSSMLSATLRALNPTTPANGSATPATSTPIRAATRAITPRWESAAEADGESTRRDMVPRVREGRAPDVSASD